MPETYSNSPENQPNEASDKYLRSLTQFHEIARQSGDERGLDLANHALAEELRRRAGEEFDPTAGPPSEVLIDPQTVTLDQALEEQRLAQVSGDQERLQRANQSLLWLSEQYMNPNQASDVPKPPEGG